MRSLLRFLLTFLSSVIIASCLLCILFPSSIDSGSDSPRGDHGDSSGWFSLRDPTALFSPTATISLTDDNSTFFNAKPAAFGPLLPGYGLSGQVWIGVGFGDDNINHKGLSATVEGELGCADIPGWSDRDWRSSQSQEMSSWKSILGGSRQTHPGRQDTHRDASRLKPQTLEKGKDQPPENDGSDDHLHYPLPDTHIPRPKRKQQQASREDIGDMHSLQKASEIEGKVVMLSRGGCGFSEKIKWAQRRGAAAVIVGDNVRGGPLVRMYARSDVSNITIPSLFTSHTTAHLLSHLIPATSEADKSLEIGKKKTEGQRSKWETAAPSTTTSSPAATSEPTRGSDEVNQREDGNDASDKGLFSALGVPTRPKSSSSRTNPQSQEETTSADSSWLSVLDFDDDGTWSLFGKTSKKSSTGAIDGFNIGKQDWRDPDLVRLSGEDHTSTSSSSSSSKATSSSGSGVNAHLKGGSITPSSGEYGRPVEDLVESQASHMALIHSGQTQTHSDRTRNTSSWLRRLFSRSSKQTNQNIPPTTEATPPATPYEGPTTSNVEAETHHSGKEPHQHFGLWVTLTPADMNASPFFNTLFVLVVSPLITLAVVYSMLLIRSRLRRRRWRAPKSVVERLPVRVYQALSNRSSPAEEPRLDIVSDTTPLLGGSRPTDIPSPTRNDANSAAASSSMASSSKYGSLEPSAAEQEKTASGLAEWKKRYGGKQKECVVCLEEYIDGVSRVMSLPCGHEFHVDCM